MMYPHGLYYGAGGMCVLSTPARPPSDATGYMLAGGVAAVPPMGGCAGGAAPPAGAALVDICTSPNDSKVWFLRTGIFSTSPNTCGSNG